MAGTGVSRTSFFTKMRLLKKDIYKRKDILAGKIYIPIEKYVKSCSYSSYREGERFVTLVLSGYSDAQVAERMGISTGTVRWREHELSVILYGIFGDDFFDLMKDAEENYGRLEKLVYLVSQDCSRDNFIPIDISSSILSRVDLDFALDSMDLSECYAELDFLCRHSIKTVQAELTNLDVYKLEYIMRVLDGSAGSSDDRYTVMKKLNSGN